MSRADDNPADTGPGVVPIFIEIARRDIALLKFLFESYEGVAVIRTLDQRKAVIVALVSRDFEDVARGMLASVRDSLTFREIPPPSGADDDWLLRYVIDDCGGKAGEIFQRSQS